MYPSGIELNNKALEDSRTMHRHLHRYQVTPRSSGKRRSPLYFPSDCALESLDPRLLLSAVYNSQVLYTFPDSSSAFPTAITADAPGNLFGISSNGGTVVLFVQGPAKKPSSTTMP